MVKNNRNTQLLASDVKGKGCLDSRRQLDGAEDIEFTLYPSASSELTESNPHQNCGKV